MRALGYYWVQRGHGEADALSRDVLAMTPPPLTQQLAEARVICALLAAGWNWDIDRVREPLTEALSAIAGFGADYGSIHPLVAMAEPLLTQYDGVTEQAQQQFEQYITARDPWLRAMGKIYLSTYAVSLGKLDGAEEHCRVGLAELRALGEQWGVAMALTQLAEFTELRADHAASIAAHHGGRGDRPRARRLGRPDVRRGTTRGRARESRGPRPGIRRDGQVQRSMEARGGQVDTDRWVSFMLAELASRAGDYAEAARCCEAVLTTIAPHEARWWQSLRAQVKARLAIALLKQGHQKRCVQLLTESLDAAAAWWEHPALATVLDACAVYALTRNKDRRRGKIRLPPRRGPRDPRRFRRVKPGRPAHPRGGPRNPGPRGLRRSLRIRPHEHLRVSPSPSPRPANRRLAVRPRRRGRRRQGSGRGG